MRTLGGLGRTAEQLALENGHTEIAILLKPRVVHNIDVRALTSLEAQLHVLMENTCKHLVRLSEGRVICVLITMLTSLG
jgi:hypothetical protein